MDCNKCEYLNIKEEQQTKAKVPHICKKYNRRVYHNREVDNKGYSILIPCRECDLDNSEEIIRINKNKLIERIEKLRSDKICFELESLKNTYTSYGLEMNIKKLKCMAVIEELKDILGGQTI